MNQTQRRYAMDKARTIFNRKSFKLQEAYTDPGVHLDDDGIRKALNDRAFFVRKRDDNSSYQNSIRSNIKFNAERDDNSSYRNSIRSNIKFNAERDKVFDQQGYEVANKLLKAEYDNLMDQLVLGGEQEALKLLQAFEVA